ncbi:MAG TPA: hypothetical protein VFC92_10340 [Bacteroidales bacterium]|nr:hypothetical protein [Bacteroidales bacterium]
MSEIQITAELQAQFLRLYQMAMTDDDFSPLEWKMLYEFAEERNISSDELDKVLLSTTGHLVVPESIDQKLEYLFDFARMIWADGSVSDDERVTLKKFCRKFGFLEENIVELSDYFIASVKEGKTKYDIIKELNS